MYELIREKTILAKKDFITCKVNETQMAKERGSRGLVFDLRMCEVRAKNQEGFDLVGILFKERLVNSL